MSQALQENGSTLASIVGSLPKWLAEWELFKLSTESSVKLYSSALPLRMHAKFWGKSMADEKQKWLNAQSPTPGEGSSLGNELQGEAMDVDVSEEDEDDDIIDGCHFLELDIESLNIPRIWIRAEYIRIYDALETFYQYPRRRAPAAVITGQPGIGES
jgi:hypothetical protein